MGNAFVSHHTVNKNTNIPQIFTKHTIRTHTLTSKTIKNDGLESRDIHSVSTFSSGYPLIIVSYVLTGSISGISPGSPGSIKMSGGDRDIIIDRFSNSQSINLNIQLCLTGYTMSDSNYRYGSPNGTLFEGCGICFSTTGAGGTLEITKSTLTVYGLELK